MEPVQLANTGVHEKVLNHFRTFTPGAVLDLPCGPGGISKALDEMGYRVTAGDIHPEYMNVPGIQAIECNMNSRLPFEDASFDYVVCVEGIEHTENPYNAIREISRILKPGGRLVITTPNYLNIERRLKFLFSGSFSKPVTAEAYITLYRRDSSFLHNSLITYPVLKFMMESNGLRITSVEKEKTKTKQVFLYPFILLIWMYTRLWPSRQRRKYLIDEINADVILNGGNNLIVNCLKT
ncbi:MAG TPA: class I SAM-dependent methyltransferase [Deltaproteobacteria bacterium]|nr:class I SAM-dependent methyltransferase [Deltaproteobacteria bacterium]